MSCFVKPAGRSATRLSSCFNIGVVMVQRPMVSTSSVLTCSRWVGRDGLRLSHSSGPPREGAPGGGSSGSKADPQARYGELVRVTETTAPTNCPHLRNTYPHNADWHYAVLRNGVPLTAFSQLVCERPGASCSTRFSDDRCERGLARRHSARQDSEARAQRDPGHELEDAHRDVGVV
jgi:hypothetical protein